MSYKMYKVAEKMLSHQRGVDGLYFVLLKRSEARHLAAKVGVNQHLRFGKQAD